MSLLFLTFQTFAQTSLSGYIIDENSIPVSGASARILELNIGTVSNQYGLYYIGSVNPGSYTIEIKYVGYKTQVKHIDLSKDESVSFALEPFSQELAEVTVLGEKEKREQIILNKMDVPLKELPVTVHGIDKARMQELGAIDLGDALKNVTGVRTRNTYGGFQHFHIRGMEQFVLLVDGVRDERHNISQSAPSTNIAAVERIDVLKGPSSVLFGHTALGGIINVLRKQPTDVFTADFNMQYGAFNTRNLSAGAGGSINSKLSFRTDFGVGESVGFRGLGSSYTNGYLSLLFKPAPSHQIQFSLQANDDFYSTDTGLPVLDDGSLVGNMSSTTRYNDPQDYLNNKRVDLQFSYRYKINDKFSLSNQLSYFVDDIDYLSTEELTFNASNDSLTRTFPFYFNHQTKPVQNQLEFNGAYKLGGLESKFVIGHSFSFLDRKTFRGNVLGEGVNATVAVVNPMLNHGNIYVEDTRYQARMEMVNGFFGQHWTKLTDRFKLLIAARVDVFNGEYYTNQVDVERNVTSEGEVSKLNLLVPTFRGGLVYDAHRTTTIYASYNNYFKPSRTVAPNGEMFDPERGYQGELGVRFEIENIAVNAAAFSLVRTNILRGLPGGGFANIGTGTSNGVEIDIQAKVNKSLSASFGYCFAQTRILRNKGDGVVNPNEGNRLPFAPEQIGNASLIYNFSDTRLEGLSLSVGGRYVSENFTTEANNHALPSYSLLDGAIAYSFSKYQLRLNVNNITDQFYYRDAIFGNQFFVGPSRNFMTSFIARF